MEYKLTFNNGRSTVIECENTGTPLQDKINKAEKQFGSEVVKVNDKPIQKHELGGFLVGALIGAGIGVVATRTRKTATKSTAKKKTTTGATKTPAGNTSKKYLPNGLIKSINTTSGKRIMNKDIVDGTYPKTAVKVPANNRYSKIAKNLDSDKTLSSQTNYLSNRRVKSVNTTFGKNISGDQIKDGFYIKDGVKFAKGGMIEMPNSNLLILGFKNDTNGNKVIRVSYPNKTAFSIQTNGNLPYSHKNFNVKTKVAELTADDLELIEEEVLHYIQLHGSKAQKESLKIYDKKIQILNYAKGGGAGKKSLMSVAHLVDWKGETLKKWYTRSYPKDELGKEMNDTSTFKDLWTGLDQNKDVYQIIGVGDSLMRERLFSYLSLIYDVDYSYVYNKWLENDDDEFAKGGALSKATYIPNRDIDSLKTTYGQTIDGKKLIDGAYATGKVKKPKMSRTQFEDETYEFAKGGFVNNGKIDKKTYFMVVKNWVYFTFNFPTSFVTTVFSKHLEDKFISLYAKYGSVSVIANFWLNLDNNNRKLLSKYVQENYFNSRADQNKLLNIGSDDYNDIITHWNMFCLNYPHNFVKDIFNTEHFTQKFDMAYQKAGSTGAVNRFFVELSEDNQEKLANWVYENYSNTGGYKFAKGGYLPNGLVKSVDTTSGKRIMNKDIIDGVYPKGTVKVPANNRYSKIQKNLDSDKNLTSQANYLPKRRIKSVNTTFGKRLYQDDINDGMYIKSGVKFATGGAVRKSGNEAKYQRQVDEVNRLISLAYDSIGDPIPVVDINSTWEQPYVYLPVKYTNGTLRISYYEVGGMDHDKIKKDIVKKSEMYFDNPLPMIARMYRKAIKQNKKQEEND